MSPKSLNDTVSQFMSMDYALKELSRSEDVIHIFETSVNDASRELSLHAHMTCNICIRLQAIAVYVSL
nr:exportin-T [Tanacetum cinerariifolium]